MGKKEEAMYSNVCQSVSISSPFLRKQVQETGEGGGPLRLLPPPPTLQHAKLMFYYHNNYYYRNPIIIILLQLNQYYCTYKRARSPADNEPLISMSKCWFILRLDFVLLFLKRGVVEEFLDEVDVAKKHPATAVPLETESVQGVALGVLGLQKSQVCLPFGSDNLATCEAPNRDDHGDCVVQRWKVSRLWGGGFSPRSRSSTLFRKGG